MGMWIRRFTGRNRSGPYDLNFLWNDGNIYIMDNHRAAAWCWLQHVSTGEHYDYIHVDKHFDALDSQIDAWINAIGALDNMSLDDYLNATYKPLGTGPPVPIVRYDNYLSILMRQFPHLIKNAFLATQMSRAPAAAARPTVESMEEVECWDLPGELGDWIEDSQQRIICNVDLDYFFYKMAPDDFRLMYSAKYIDDLFEVIHKYRDSGQIAVITMSLSPENCGGWAHSEEILDAVVQALGLDFSVPSDEEAWR